MSCPTEECQEAEPFAISLALPLGAIHACRCEPWGVCMRQRHLSTQRFGLCSAPFHCAPGPSCAVHTVPFLSSFPCSQSYLQAASDGPAGHSLDPAANYNSPKFRSRNQSYMRAVSMLSQASCVSQVGTPCRPASPGPHLYSCVPGVFLSG